MNIKPTPEQVDDWELKAAQYADSQTGEYYEYQQAKNEKFAELAAQWGAAQAQQPTEPKPDVVVEYCIELSDSVGNDPQSAPLNFWTTRKPNCKFTFSADGVLKDVEVLQ